ncbi:MAG: sedoheptulokinase [Armatimonadota bacterium]
MKSLLLGLDIGTTKICAVAIEAETRMVIAIETVLNNSHLSVDNDGAEQEPLVILKQACKMLHQICLRIDSKIYSIDGFGVTGQMHGVVLVDSTGNPITPLISWQDKRGHHRYERFQQTYVEELRQCLGDTSDAGCEPATGYGAVTLLRLWDEGLLPTGSHALTIQDFVVYQLCGSMTIDPSDAASWGIFDVHHGKRWLPSALKALPFLERVLPEIYATGTTAGRLTSCAASITGLPQGLPIAVATGDNQASFIGSVPSVCESMLLNLGTGGQISIPVDHFVLLPSVETRPLFSDYRLLVGASLCGGRAYNILADFFIRVGHELFGCNSDSLFDKMNQIAGETIADCENLKASTLFEGTRSNPDIRGSFTNIDSQNLTPGNMIRACITGMVDELIDMYLNARDAGVDIKYVVGAGNAIRRNPVVRSEIERRLSMFLHESPNTEEAAVGAALIGGYASEVFSQSDIMHTGRASDNKVFQCE